MFRALGLETLHFTIHIGSTPTFWYFDLYLYFAFAAHYVYSNLNMNARIQTVIDLIESEIDLNECEHFLTTNLNRSDLIESVGGL